jgi:hypothetical protein
VDRHKFDVCKTLPIHVAIQQTTTQIQYLQIHRTTNQVDMKEKHKTPPPNLLTKKTPQNKKPRSKQTKTFL